LNVRVKICFSLPGYGKFNYLLLLAILPASFSSIFSSSSMSYVLPSAECDLQLTMFDKGLLNSMSFAGGILIPLNDHITTLYYRCEGARNQSPKALEFDILKVYDYRAACTAGSVVGNNESKREFTVNTAPFLFFLPCEFSLA
jgi:hypothetical protein